MSYVSYIVEMRLNNKWSVEHSFHVFAKLQIMRGFYSYENYLYEIKISPELRDIIDSMKKQYGNVLVHQEDGYITVNQDIYKKWLYKNERQYPKDGLIKRIIIAIKNEFKR